MSQTWTNDSFAAGHVAQTDLVNMENNFLALHSSFSGAAAPAGAVEGLLWRDTAKEVLKQYNGASWFGMFHGDASQKILVYDDTVLEGYLRDAGVTDKVIALKGGATYVTAGVTAGSWTIGGITSANESAHVHAAGAHTHTLVNEALAAASGATWAVVANNFPVVDTGVVRNYQGNIGGTSQNVLSDVTAAGSGNTNAGSAHNHVISQDGTARIAAAVVILEYLDL